MNKGPARINPYMMFHGAFVPNWLLLRPEVSQGAKLCYARLCQFAGKDGKCFPSQAKLAVELGISRVQVSRYIKDLETLELIGRLRTGCNKVNQYFFFEHPWMGLHPDANNSLHPEVKDSLHPDVTDMIPPDVTDSLQGIYSNKEIPLIESLPHLPGPEVPPKGVRVACQDANEPSGTSPDSEGFSFIYYDVQNGILEGLTQQNIDSWCAQFDLDRLSIAIELVEFKEWLEDGRKFERLTGNLHPLLLKFFNSASHGKTGNLKRAVGRRLKKGSTLVIGELLASMAADLVAAPGGDQ